jgi:hypothetical protein
MLVYKQVQLFDELTTSHPQTSHVATLLGKEAIFADVQV